MISNQKTKLRQKPHIGPMYNVARFLAARGLAIRGIGKILESTESENFMGIRELISNFESFSKAHMEKFGNAGSRTSTYHSLNTCEELPVIQIM